MKLLLALTVLIVCLPALAAQQAFKLVANAANTPITITITTQSNVQVSLSPDGVLDGLPVWVGSGQGQLFVSGDAMNGTISSTVPGTYTLTITATSQGHPLSDTVIVTITAPQNPPATSLRTSVKAVLKTP